MVKKKNKNKVFSFIQGIKNESKKVLWTSKKSLVKYSVATILFMIFVCLFFIGADLLIALLMYIKELVI